MSSDLVASSGADVDDEVPDDGLRMHIEGALERSRADARWFAIGTVVFTPFALIGSALILLVAIEMTVDRSRYSRGMNEPMFESAFDSGMAFPSVVVLALLLFAGRGHWRSPWVWGGLGIYSVMLAATFGTSFSSDSPVIFIGVWAVFAVVAITLTSQVYEPGYREAHSLVAVVPNAVIMAYRTVLRNVLTGGGEEVDLRRAVAVLKAVRSKDVARRRRLFAAAGTNGVELESLLLRAKLIRRYRGEFRLGAAAPPSLR
ncbi:MAG: hypothetical protein JKY37_28600 [Nannocystaceae bacterium]|nr:hypothetical protein [Nannocystaceae bacterium]